MLTFSVCHFRNIFRIYVLFFLLLIILGVRATDTFLDWRYFQNFLVFEKDFVFSGKVCGEPSYFDNSISFSFCVREARRKTKERFPVDAQTRLFLNRTVSLEISRGDFLMLQGLQYPRILEHFPNDSFLLDFRKWFLRRITTHLHEPAASFLSGILVGFQPSFPMNVKEDFRRVGLTHILVVSGSNVALFLVFLNGILFFVPRKKRFWILIPGVLFFIFFVGLSPPSLRAGLMGLLMLSAVYFRRNKSAPRFLFLAALVMLTFDPYTIFDKGFQLSFLATASIFFLYPILSENIFSVSSEDSVSRAYFASVVFRILRELFLLTLSVEIFSLPVLFSFQEFSLIAPLTNTLLLPFLPLLLFAGFFSLFVVPFAPVFEFFVDFYLFLVQFFARFSFATIPVSVFSWPFVIVYYLLLAFFLFRFRKSR